MKHTYNTYSTLTFTLFTNLKSVTKKPHTIFRTVFSSGLRLHRNNEVEKPNFSYFYEPRNSNKTYEQILERPHLFSFQSNNDNEFSPQWAAKSDLSTDYNISNKSPFNNQTHL